jgi:hypothetical protein
MFKNINNNPLFFAQIKSLDGSGITELHPDLLHCCTLKVA